LQAALTAFAIFSGSGFFLAIWFNSKWVGISPEEYLQLLANQLDFIEKIAAYFTIMPNRVCKKQVRR